MQFAKDFVNRSILFGCIYLLSKTKKSSKSGKKHAGNIPRTKRELNRLLLEQVTTIKATDSGAQLFMDRTKQSAREVLRALTLHQLAIRPTGFLGHTWPKIVDRFQTHALED